MVETAKAWHTDKQKAERKLRGRSTSYIKREYNNLNDLGRRIARDEFKKRRVPAKELPYKKRSKSRSRTRGSGFRFGLY